MFKVMLSIRISLRNRTVYEVGYVFVVLKCHGSRGGARKTLYIGGPRQPRYLIIILTFKSNM